MAAMLSAAVGPEGYGLCLCSFGDGLVSKQDDSQIDEANKSYLRNTDHFKVITPNLNLKERVPEDGVRFAGPVALPC